MFPDLGDVQFEKIRSAIRQSYTRLGRGAAGGPTRIAEDANNGNLDSVGNQTTATIALTIPEFRAFFDLLQ